MPVDDNDDSLTRSDSYENFHKALAAQGIESEFIFLSLSLSMHQQIGFPPWLVPIPPNLFGSICQCCWVLLLFKGMCQIAGFMFVQVWVVYTYTCAHATAMMEIKRVLMFVVETTCNNFVMLILVGQAIEALGVVILTVGLPCLIRSF